MKGNFSLKFPLLELCYYIKNPSNAALIINNVKALARIVVFYEIKYKGKDIPLQAWTGP
jgi:hypothetical protein